MNENIEDIVFVLVVITQTLLQIQYKSPKPSIRRLGIEYKPT